MFFSVLRKNFACGDFLSAFYASRETSWKNHLGVSRNSSFFENWSNDFWLVFWIFQPPSTVEQFQWKSSKFRKIVNVFHCWPEKFQTFVIVFASYVTEGTFSSKTFRSKSIQENFVSNLSENFAGGFVRAALEVSGSQLELRKTSEEKVSGKCSIFHVFPDFGKSFTLTVVTSPFYTSTWLVWLPFSLKLSI